ncbi:MAG TPA: hypothetical protein VJB36_07235 [Methylomirabilota bacterium]|nr:hypothetical protein [Methylomirabilota bacterium]
MAVRRGDRPRRRADAGRPAPLRDYATLRKGDAITVIGLADHRELERIPTGKGPHGMALIPPRQ